MTNYELTEAIEKLNKRVCCSTKGLKRVTETERLELTPIQGVIVFQTDGTVGWYGYDGTSWQQLQTVV